MGHEAFGAPFDKIAMDILEPGVITEAGNRYILVVSDYFTKWVEAYSLPNHTAQTVADVLVIQFFYRYGVPTQIHSDQVPEFESKLMKELCTLLDCVKTRTTPYHPQSDGLVERANRTILMMLRVFVNEYQNNWDDVLPYIMAAYRSSVHESTGNTPNLMMFGRENSLPLYLSAPVTDVEYPKCEQAFVQWIRDAMQQAHAFARDR